MFQFVEQPFTNVDDLRASLNDYKDLVRKLRWLDMEDEAQELENRLRSLVPVESIRLLPIDTD